MVEVFFSYAHYDEELMNDVRRQLVIFERNNRILKWHDRKIPAGSEWKKQIDQRLNQAHIILLFVSPHFLESRYCYEIEGQAALSRHAAGETIVIPIILRPCAWEEAPFSKLQALPRDAKPISTWADRDEACLNAARGVMAVVDNIASGRHVFSRQEEPSEMAQLYEEMIAEEDRNWLPRSRVCEKCGWDMSLQCDQDTPCYYCKCGHRFYPY